MKISSFCIYKYALELARPVYVHGIKLNHREGFIIHLESDRNTEGLGEIVPLEGRSKESLEQAQDQIQKLKTYLTGREIPSGVEKLEGKMQSWFKEMHLKPSVQFGIEMAILNLIAGTRGTTLCQSITTANHNYGHVNVNALLNGTVEEVALQAQKLKADGFADMKLKVGGSIDESAAKVRAVNGVLNGQALLHLDANRAWDLEEAVRFGREIECSAVTYIEEPLKHVYQSPEFFQETMIPVALDESLLKLSFDEIRSMDGVDVLILKPTLLGGIEKTWGYMQQASSLGLNAVISSSLESGIGLLALANLAGCATREPSAGLDTLKLFRKDLVQTRQLIEHGKINIRQPILSKEDINFNLLKEINA